MRPSTIGFCAVTLVSLCACMDTADTFPINAAAKDTGRLKIEFQRTGLGQGPITITMPDGEVLTGHYRVAYEGSEAFAFSGAHMATAIAIGNGNVQFVAGGPKTQMLCRGTNSISGHGNGQCQTDSGAIWAINW